MSPFELEFLLHCYYTPNPSSKVRNEIIQQFAVNMIQSNILEEGNGIFTVTDKGKIWIQHILETPMPVMTWIRGEIAK